MTGEPPANGTSWRLNELERRMAAVEQNGPKVIRVEAKVDTLTNSVDRLDRDLRDEVSRFGEGLRAEMRETRGETRYLRRVLLGLFVSVIVGLIFLVVSQYGTSM